MISRTSAALSLALAATPLAAQNATTYHRNPGDTLRYHELTETDMKGPMAGESRREATMAIALGSGDEASAWLEASSAVTKMQGREMTSPAVLNKPVPIVFHANGAVEATTPGGPGGNPFASLFVKLPDRPLALGAEWADTTAPPAAGPPVPGNATPLVVRYKVVRDSATTAGKVLIIEGKGDVVSRSKAPGGNGEVKTTVSEKDRFVFSADLGRMLSRDRTIETTRRTTAPSPERGPRTDIGRAAANPKGRLELGIGDSRAMDSRTTTHTSIELLGAQQLKAAPAK